MAKVTFDVRDGDVINMFEENIRKLTPKLLDDTYKFFVKATPIRSGNARRNTNLNKQKNTIEADYAYAGRLNNGWSKQAPDGMTEPTIEYMKRSVSKHLKGKGKV
jgi:hypothetical protein